MKNTDFPDFSPAFGNTCLRGAGGREHVTTRALRNFPIRGITKLPRGTRTIGTGNAFPDANHVARLSHSVLPFFRSEVDATGGAVKAGALGLLGGLGMDQLAALEQKGGGKKKKSVIYIFLSGGLAQHESFDMKPDAPADIRGEFRPIPDKDARPAYLRASAGTGKAQRRLGPLPVIVSWFERAL